MEEHEYISSLLRKGKLKCWKLVEKYQKFQTAFTQFGSSWILSDELFEQLKEYVFTLYGLRQIRVNEVRYRLFMK